MASLLSSKNSHSVAVPSKELLSVAVGDDVPLPVARSSTSFAKESGVAKQHPFGSKDSGVKNFSVRTKFFKPDSHPKSGVSSLLFDQQGSSRNNNSSAASPRVPPCSTKDASEKNSSSMSDGDSHNKHAGWPWRNKEIKLKFAGDRSKRARY